MTMRNDTHTGKNEVGAAHNANESKQGQGKDKKWDNDRRRKTKSKDKARTSTVTKTSKSKDKNWDKDRMCVNGRGHDRSGCNGDRGAPAMSIRLASACYN